MNKKGARTKELIKQNAYSLFTAKGYCTVSIKDIAEKCNMTKEGICHHYKSCQEIFEEVLKEISKKESSYIRESIEKELPAKMILDTVFDKLKKEVIDREYSLSYAIYEYSASVDNYFMVRFNKSAIRKWKLLLEYGIGRGEFADVDVDKMAEMILCMYHGIRMWGRMLPVEEKTFLNIMEVIKRELGYGSIQFELRKWKQEDSTDVAHYANNEMIAANLRNVFPYPYTLQDAETYVSSCVENNEEQQICRAILVDGHVAGSIGIFCGTDVYEKSGELGYWLAEEYWGNGIMTGAVKQICKEAFEKFDIVRIYAEPFVYNTGSRRVLEKAGFALEGIMKNGVCKNGQIHDYCMYALIKEGIGKIDI